MSKKILVVLAGVTVLCGAGAVAAREHEHKLPPGPIADRHELMEGIGKNAKVIGDAMKTGKYDPVAGAAEKIQAASGKITGLFPPGSTHENSRAKPEIWTHWPEFEADAKELQTTSAALAAAAHAGAGIPEAAEKMFGSCKSCHDQFRVPKK